MKKLLFSLVCIVSTLSAISQVSIGNGTVNNQPLPIDPYYGFSYTQTIFDASEINASGNIDSLSYFVVPGSNLSSSSEWLILMGHTTQTDFSSSSWLDANTLDTAFHGTISIVNDTVIIVLDQSFAYNGTDNLAIAVIDEQAGYNGWSDKFYCTESAQPVSFSYADDGAAVDPYNPPTLGSSSAQYFPNITLHGITQSCPNLTNLSVTELTDFSVVLNWSSTSYLDYEVEFGDSSLAFGSGSILTSSTNSLFIDTLSANTDYRFYVKQICTVGDSSNWVGTFNFTTLCSAYMPEYSQDFSTFLPDCWELRKGLISDSTTFEEPAYYYPPLGK